MNHLKKIKKNLKWILLFLFILIILNYKHIPGYHGFLLENSYKVHCAKNNMAPEDDSKDYIPCNTFLDCRKSNITEYCDPDEWSMGTKCDYNCNVRAFCLNGHCRSNSYMGTPFLW